MKFYLFLFLFAVSNTLAAQEVLREFGFSLDFQKLSQSGKSGLTYTDAKGLTASMDLIDEGGANGPGMCLFYNKIFLVNRFWFNSGFEFSYKYLSGTFLEKDDYFTDYTTTRTIEAKRYAFTVPVEAGFMVVKAKKRNMMIVTSCGIKNDFILKTSVEGETTGLNKFINNHLDAQRVIISPFFRIRLKSNIVGIYYSLGTYKNDYGQATIRLFDHQVGMTLSI
jgi:hypothetical protein